MSVITPARRALIEDKVREDLQLVRDENGRIKVPVPLEIIANKYSLEILEVNFQDPAISGMLKRDMGVIAVNSKDSYRRQVFTIAHELGHIALHDKDEVYRMDAQQVEVDSAQEKEANWYAARILMPEEEVKQYWIQHAPDVRIMADIFGVSMTAMANRLINLDLLPNT